MKRRFKYRPKRISRRTERDKFERMVMPAAYISLPVAVAILIAAALGYLVYGTIWPEILTLGFAMLAIPVVLMVFRLVRGHYSDALDEP
jgi:hypothetical protein